MNSLNFTGNLGRDCETRFTPGGDAITSFSVALTSGYGEKKITSWMNCSIWGKRGESVAPYLKKGTQVAISGELALRPYTNKDGIEKVSPDVRVNDLTLIGGRSTESAHAPSEPKQKQNEQNGSGFDDFESDIPFN
jgi:single-strand DNA-binding protein